MFPVDICKMGPTHYEELADQGMVVDRKTRCILFLSCIPGWLNGGQKCMLEEMDEPVERDPAQIRVK
jgi:hypothetical protein